MGQDDVSVDNKRNGLVDANIPELLKIAGDVRLLDSNRMFFESIQKQHDIQIKDNNESKENYFMNVGI